MCLFTHVYDPNIMPYPTELEDVLYGHKLKDNTYNSLKAINEIVQVTKNLGALDEGFDVQFLNGGYSNVVLGMSLKQIQEDEPARVILKIIELFHLDSYFNLENETKELESLAEKELQEILK